MFIDTSAVGGATPASSYGGAGPGAAAVLGDLEALTAQRRSVTRQTKKSTLQYLSAIVSQLEGRQDESYVTIASKACFAATPAPVDDESLPLFLIRLDSSSP